MSSTKMNNPFKRDKEWFVLYTKPRHERKLASRLEAAGWSVFCPLKKTIRQWSDRKKVIEEPLFSSLIFIECEEKDRNKVFINSSAQRYLFWLGKPAVVRRQEIQTLKQWLCNVNDHDESYTELITSGSEVQVNGGPLMGQKGKIEEHRGFQATIKLEPLGVQVRINTQHTPLSTI